jgi:hypothetical protein
MPARQTPLAPIHGGFIASSCCLERGTEGTQVFGFVKKKTFSETKP